MTFEEYVEAQADIVAKLVAVLLVLLNPFRLRRLGGGHWNTLLTITYPYVDDARRQSAELARDFYDAERKRETGEAERHDFYRANYKPEWYATSMEHTRKNLSKPGATEGSVENFVKAAVTQVENGGRKTTLRAVESDPKVKGWARVATGKETCSWCLMLVSRGPVYGKAKDAGLKVGKAKAVELNRQIDNAETPEQAAEATDVLLGFMDRWHDNCDCKVVPVFNTKNWTGRDEFLAAEKLWKKATKGYSGKNAVNAFRRAVESGRLDEFLEELNAAA